MRNNPVQFAVVREDPEIEAELILRLRLNARIFLIASGGCTALTLRARFPNSTITAFDPNPAQLDLIRRKMQALAHLEAFGVNGEDTSSLTACGNFESLFRSLREFIYDFVLEREAWLRFFKDGWSITQAFDSKYWPVAFELFFSDRMLTSMFGEAAVQHAEKGSYPKYFQNVFERGLKAEGARENYFLHHVLLGHYLHTHLPAYLTEEATRPAELILKLGFAQDVSDFADFDLISFSNIFDWMPRDEVRALAKKVSDEAKPGTYLVYRQLNNATNFENYFSSFRFDEALSEKLFARDRSLFYSSLHIGKV